MYILKLVIKEFIKDFYKKITQKYNKVTILVLKL